MRILPPTRRRSVLRSLTTTTNRPVRLIALVALVALAGTVFATSNSAASSLGRTLFTRAADLIAPANAAHAHHALEAAELEPSSSTMLTERRGHTATRLADGRVLIAGGENASGPLNTAEIYDPVAATFSTSGNMNEARADHSATLLADGRVLLIGGRNAAGALASTEIFDPATGAFTSGPSMSAARAGHTATLLADGRVFVAGGNSAEILNASQSAFTSAGTLNSARSRHSAALLQDGRVVLVGGRDGSGNELATGEIFDPPASSFSPIAGALKVARVRPHLRVLFDGKVQIIGGNNDRSMEVYDPLYEGFGAYAHVLPESDPCTGLAGQVLASQTRAALFHNGQTDPLFDRTGHTITELDGQALVIGGANSSGAVLNSSALVASSGAAISTDKLDYEPGQIAYISGRAFQPGETVRVKIHEDPHTPQERGFDVVADSEGNFSGEYVVMDYDLNMKFIAGARGLTSGRTAQTTFTDSNNFSVTPLTQTVAAGSTNTFAWVFTAQNSGNQQTTTFTVPAGWTTPQVGAGPGQVTVAGSGASPCNVSLQSIVGMVITIRQSPPAPATGTCNNNTSFTLTYADATAPSPATTTTYTFANQHGQDPAVTVTTNVATTLMLAAPSPASVAFGSTGPVTLSATLTSTTGGAAVAGATIDFTIDGSSVGSGVTNASGVATLSYDPSTLNAGPHTVQASFAGQVISGTTYNSSTSGTQTLTVTKRDTLTTVSSSQNPSTFGESVSFTATVAGTGAGAGDPSGGSVQFKIDGANFGAPVALASGSATSGSISTLTAGNHTIEAFFTSADTNFNDSNDSLDGGQTVNKRDTLTTVSSSLNPSTYGQTVTFTASVAGTGPGAGDPAGGSVQFKIDGANFGAPVALAGGSATSGSISTLTAGNHTIEAFFTSSDTNFNDSNDSLDGGQTVNKASLTITASSHTIIFNDPVPTITPSYAGFVLGEDPSNLTTQPTCSTTYTVGSLIGTYPTKCENAASPNYTFTYVNGTVTVLTACSAFNGFLAPINGAVENGTGGSFSDPVRAFKLNSTIPVKFSAICFGAPLTTGIHTLSAAKYSNSTTGDSPIDATPTDSATSGNQFRLTDGQWHFNLSTKALGGNAQGLWLLKATLFDGSTYTVWVEVKK